jgi:hypothetical protein
MTAIQVLSSLPYPFSLFQKLCLEFAFLRIHGACFLKGEKKYCFQLFRFFPSGRLYCQQWITSVNVEKIVAFLNIPLDFIRPLDCYQACGSIYLQVPLNKLSQLLE